MGIGSAALQRGIAAGPFGFGEVDFEEDGDPKKPDSIRIGSRVRVEFEQASDDIHIPFWRVVEEESA